MGIFNLLFKKKKEKITSSDSVSIEQNDKLHFNNKAKKEDEEDTYSRRFKLDSNEISLTELNKRITKLYKESGFDQAKNLFEMFWSQNQNSLLLIDTHRYVNNFVNILKKEKYSSDEIVSFINEKISKYPESNEYSYVLQKAKMLKKFDLKKSLEYLKAKNDSEETQISNRELFVEAIYLESEYLLKNKNYEFAFRNLRRTSMVIPHFDQFTYLRWSARISNLSGKICFEENKPKYDSYLFYEISSYLIDVLVQISSFPQSFNFYRWKSEYKTSNWPYGDDKYFDKALDSLNMLNSKNELINELKEFAYFKLPELYGIPKKYDSYDKIEKATDLDSEEYIGWHELSKISEKLSAKFADKEVIAIHTFVQNLTKIYYDKNNQT